MIPIKSQIKIEAINELGVKCDDMREALRREVLRKEGYLAALNEIQQSTLRSFFERVDRDRDAEKFDLPTSTLIKDYLAKVHAALDKLRLNNEHQRVLVEGRIVGLQDAIAVAKKARDTEQSRLTMLEEQLAPAVITEEPPPRSGARPDAQNAAVEDLRRRRAEAKALETDTKPTNGTVAEQPGTSAMKRRGRPKGSKNRPKQAEA